MSGSTNHGFSLTASLRAVLRPRPAAPESALLFATSADPDPVARFLAEDVPALDWRADFLRSPAMDEIFLGLETEIEEETEEETVFSTQEIVTTGSGFVAD